MASNGRGSGVSVRQPLLPVRYRRLLEGAVLANKTAARRLRFVGNSCGSMSHCCMPNVATSTSGMALVPLEPPITKTAS